MQPEPREIGVKRTEGHVRRGPGADCGGSARSGCFCVPIFNGAKRHDSEATEEMDVGLYHLRTRALSFDGGNADFHKEKVACELENLEPDYKKLYA